MNFIPKHGGFQKLISYQKSVIVYDATVYFTNKYLSKRDRTVDQMVQAAVLASKTLLKLVWHQALPRKQKLN